MGNVLRKAIKPVKNFTLEWKVNKYLNSDKIHISPKHSSYIQPSISIEEEKRLFDKQPIFVDKIQKFDIKERKITDGILPPGKTYGLHSHRPLPQKFNIHNPLPPPHIEFGFVIPQDIPNGRVTVRNIIKMLKLHQLNNASYEELAQEFNLPLDVTCNICMNFKLLHILPTEYGDRLLPPYLKEAMELNLLEAPKFVDSNDIEPIGGYRKLPIISESKSKISDVEKLPDPNT